MIHPTRRVVLTCGVMCGTRFGARGKRDAWKYARIFSACLVCRVLRAVLYRYRFRAKGKVYAYCYYYLCCDCDGIAYNVS